MKTAVKGIVLACEPRRENDKLVWVLTDQGQIIRLYASGARRSVSRLRVSTEPFVYSEFEIYESRNGFALDEAAVLDQFFGLRANIASYALAGYFSQLITKVFSETVDEDIFSVLHTALKALENGGMDPVFIKPIFEFKVSQYSGWCPSVTECACGGKEACEVWFSISSGGYFCDKCNASMPADGHRIPRSVLFAIRHCTSNRGKKAFMFKLNQDALAYFSQLAEAFVLFHIEDRLPALDYYKEVLAESNI